MGLATKSAKVRKGMAGLFIRVNRIKVEMKELDFGNVNEWHIRNNYFMEMLPEFQTAFGPFVKELK